MSIKTKQKRTFNTIQNDDGKLLTENAEIVKEWGIYYQNLFSDKDDGNWDNLFRQKVEADLMQIDRESYVEIEGGKIDKEEVEREIKNLRLRKAPGWDLVTAEHIKYGGENLKTIITWIINAMIICEDIPTHFKKGLIVPIPKPGKDSAIKDNNRGITLLCVIYKLFENVMIKREDAFLHSSQTIEDIQRAGQVKCASMHSSFLVQETVTHHLNKGSTVYAAFLDTKNAFDTVWVDGLLYKLYRAGMHIKTWRLILKSYTGFQCAVIANGHQGEWFTTERGVHQGAPFSMWLYMIFINDLIKELKSSGYGTVIYRIPVASPCHADDIALIALYKMGLNELLKICVDYAKHWRYDYNMSKTECLIWGKDKDPNVDIKMNDQVLDVKTHCKHVGVLLFTDKQRSILEYKKRCSASRAVLLAARGMGSANVPVPPSTLSKIYWAVAVPKLTYGMEVTPLSDTEIETFEVAHRQNAKITQGLPSNIPNPASLATLGWLSMRSYISLLKIMFIFRLLCSPFNSVYKQIMILKLNECIDGNCGKLKGPISDMYTHAMKYGLDVDVRECLLNMNTYMGKIDKWKTIVKNVIWQNEIAKWKISCMLYKELDIYRMCIDKLAMNAWWSLLKLRPYLGKQVSGVMAVLLGGQPSGLQCNFGGAPCRICDARVKDTKTHVLLYCEAMQRDREIKLNIVLDSMPPAMKNSCTNLNGNERLIFLLSGLKSNSTTEWPDVYEAIAHWVYSMYEKRKEKYDYLDEMGDG